MQIANFHLLPLFLVFPGSAVSFSLPLFARVSAAPQAVSEVVKETHLLGCRKPWPSSVGLTKSRRKVCSWVCPHLIRAPAPERTALCSAGSCCPNELLHLLQKGFFHLVSPGWQPALEVFQNTRFFIVVYVLKLLSNIQTPNEGVQPGTTSHAKWWRINALDAIYVEGVDLNLYFCLCLDMILFLN